MNPVPMVYSETMRIILLIMVLLITSVHAEEVYRSVDESGNIIYTDKPTPDAEVIRIDEIQTVDTPEVGPFEYTPEKKPAGAAYTLAITSPASNAAIENAAGEFTVSASVQPVLNTAAGHKLVLYMDGAIAAEGGPQFSLTNVDRGTHSLSVAVKNATGAEVSRSAAVSFTLHRQSKQHTPSTVGKPPKPAK